MSKIDEVIYQQVMENTVNRAVLDSTKIRNWRENVREVVDGIVDTQVRIVLSTTEPASPTTNTYWYEDLGEGLDLGGGGLVIGNASLDGDDDIWFDVNI